MVFIDAHCHLGSKQFDSDRIQVIDRMLEKDVRKGIMICCSRHDLIEVKKVRDILPGFKLACSIHPQDLEYDSSQERLVELKKAVNDYNADMIGETGLDYHSHPNTKKEQNMFFDAQLQMAADLSLPVDIHSRKASQDTLETIKRYPVRGIIHSFSGSYEMAELFIKQGYWISFGASMMFKGAKKPAEIIRRLPLNRLLLETDAPYQSPSIGSRHEPGDVAAIYNAVSLIRGIPVNELAEQIEKNFDEVFQS